MRRGEFIRRRGSRRITLGLMEGRGIRSSCRFLEVCLISMVGRYSTGACGSSRIGKVNTLSRILWGFFQRTSDSGSTGLLHFVI